MQARAEWRVGSFVKCDGKEGKITRDPDSDLDVKLEWARGGTSGWIKVWRLTRSNERDFEREKVCEYCHHCDGADIPLS